MLMTENVAREKWCPHVRIDNNNRLHNSLTDGFQNSEKMYHCIARRLHGLAPASAALSGAAGAS